MLHIAEVIKAHPQIVHTVLIALPAMAASSGLFVGGRKVVRVVRQRKAAAAALAEPTPVEAIPADAAPVEAIPAPAAAPVPAIPVAATPAKAAAAPARSFGLPLKKRARSESEVINLAANAVHQVFEQREKQGPVIDGLRAQIDSLTQKQAELTQLLQSMQSTVSALQSGAQGAGGVIVPAQLRPMIDSKADKADLISLSQFVQSHVASGPTGNEIVASLNALSAREAKLETALRSIAEKLDGGQGFRATLDSTLQ
jgi:hypothetical protein